MYSLNALNGRHMPQPFDTRTPQSTHPRKPHAHARPHAHTHGVRACLLGSGQADCVSLRFSSGRFRLDLFACLFAARARTERQATLVLSASTARPARTASPERTVRARRRKLPAARPS